VRADLAVPESVRQSLALTEQGASMISIFARIVLVAALIPVLGVPFVDAANLLMSPNGNDANACTFAAPCQSLGRAIAVNESDGGDEAIGCVASGDYPIDSAITISKSVTIDCSGTSASVYPLTINGSGITVTLRNITIFNWPNKTAILLTNGTLVLDNVHIIRTGEAISAQPIGPSKLVIKNSIFENNNAGLLIKPGSGGSVVASFDHVTTTNNNGGGLKIDTTNGSVTVDVIDSNISFNAGNGLNAVGGAGGPAMFNIHNSVIAKNATAGVQVNGATAAAMLDTTLLDSNASGATTVINGGHILTYGSNRIIGTAGSGFTGSASPQ
jgi:hypothetical protein